MKRGTYIKVYLLWHPSCSIYLKSTIWKWKFLAKYFAARVGTLISDNITLISRTTFLQTPFCPNHDFTNNRNKCGQEREPWSSGYGRRLMYRRLWERIPAPYTGWTFFHIPLFAVKIVMFVWNDKNKKTKMRPGTAHLKQQQIWPFPNGKGQSIFPIQKSIYL